MTQELLADWRFYLGLVINGVFTGFAVAIGNYLANKGILNRMEQGVKKLIKGQEEIKKLEMEK